MSGYYSQKTTNLTSAKDRREFLSLTYVCFIVALIVLFLEI